MIIKNIEKNIGIKTNNEELAFGRISNAYKHIPRAERFYDWFGTDWDNNVHYQVFAKSTDGNVKISGVPFEFSCYYVYSFQTNRIDFVLCVNGYRLYQKSEMDNYIQNVADYIYEQVWNIRQNWRDYDTENRKETLERIKDIITPEIKRYHMRCCDNVEYLIHYV